MNKLKVMIADDERPARLFLKSILEEFDDIDIIGEAENGLDAVEIIRRLKPDLALLDLQMPEASGIDVVRLIGSDHMPLVAFVTAHDEFAIQAFEVNAIDYLLKPVEKPRLAKTIDRARAGIGQASWRLSEAEKLKSVVDEISEFASPQILERIPVRQREEILLIPVREVVCIIADGELLAITNTQNKKFTINHRLKDIESRLEPNKFIRLSRSALVNMELIDRVSPMPGGTYLVTLKTGQRIPVSRMQSKLLRERFLKI